jgi:hypothetical protein
VIKKIPDNFVGLIIIPRLVHELKKRVVFKNYQQIFLLKKEKIPDAKRVHTIIAWTRQNFTV